MINTGQFIKDLSLLGLEFEIVSGGYGQGGGAPAGENSDLAKAIENAFLYNPWFIPPFVKVCMSAWASALKEENLVQWLRGYEKYPGNGKEPLTVGIIMAGNIPMVGFHDLLCVLASGNLALVKLSSSDDILVPAVLRVLSNINPVYKDLVSFTDGPLKRFDAIIATGSNNSSRYFDYYFGKYPHIIRKNRNGVAVLTGRETEDDLVKLSDDIFIYFGLGCRNVSKIYIPDGYDIRKIFNSFSKYSFFADHNKYRNNYDYQKSILLINRVPHLDTGFLLVKPDHSMISPISVVHTETYLTIEQLNNDLVVAGTNIQCIISSLEDVKNSILPGRSQYPELWDYADGIDTMEFLINLGI
jgi:hypothetical protein